MQEWTGEAEVGLAKARWERVRGRPAENPERLFVANNLAVTLKEAAGDPEGALSMLREVLAVRRRVLGSEHPDTLDSITNLALLLAEMGCYSAALPLSQEVVAAIRLKREAREPAAAAAAAGERAPPDDVAAAAVGLDFDADEEAAHAIRSLAAVLDGLGDHAQAKPLHDEALAIRRDALGEEHLDTINSRHGLGHCLVRLGRRREGIAMLEAAVEAACRVLGAEHPSTRHFSCGLESARQRRPTLSSEAGGAASSGSAAID